jgi:hypothetical protein
MPHAEHLDPVFFLLLGLGDGLATRADKSIFLGIRLATMAQGSFFWPENLPFSPQSLARLT